MTHCITLLTAILCCLSACTASSSLNTTENRPVYELPTLYDYQLLDKHYQPLSLAQLAASLADVDVVFVGEYHRNQASHLLQMRLLQALHQQRQRPIVLAMEQFERDQQGIVDNYLKHKVGERYLIEEGSAWKNYQGSYRPLVEYARQHKLPVIAANAPGQIIRCIGRQGESYLDKLSAEEKKLLAAQPFADVPGYADKFFGLMGGSGHARAGKRMQQSYLAQLARDNTMAESIARALQQTPGAQVVHLNGRFHSAGHLGTAGALKRIHPELNIAVITPVHVDTLAEFKQDNQHPDDFYYLLNRQPQEFVNPESMKKRHKAMFTAADKKAASCH